jgi:hypothetical protein
LIYDLISETLILCPAPLLVTGVVKGAGRNLLFYRTDPEIPSESGMASVLAPMYISEFSPPHLRGSVLLLQYSFIILFPKPREKAWRRSKISGLKKAILKIYRDICIIISEYNIILFSGF